MAEWILAVTVGVEICSPQMSRMNTWLWQTPETIFKGDAVLCSIRVLHDIAKMRLGVLWGAVLMLLHAFFCSTYIRNLFKFCECAWFLLSLVSALNLNFGLFLGAFYWGILDQWWFATSLIIVDIPPVVPLSPNHFVKCRCSTSCGFCLGVFFHIHFQNHLTQRVVNDGKWALSPIPSLLVGVSNFEAVLYESCQPLNNLDDRWSTWDDEPQLTELFDLHPLFFGLVIAHDFECSWSALNLPMRTFRAC